MHPVEVSRWLTVTADMVRQHALNTGDGFAEWVHCDAERAAREMPFGGAIVQGFLQLSLLIQLCQDIADDDPYDINHSLNYGFDRLRFLHPLVVGRAVRVRVLQREKTPHPRGGMRLKLTLELEDDQGNIVLAADWLFYRQPLAAPAPADCSLSAESWARLLQQQATDQPEQITWVLAEQQLTNAQAWQQVQALAAVLRQCGLRPGDRVLVLSAPRPEAWALFLACSLCQAVYTPLDPSSRDATLGRQINQADPALLFDFLPEPRLPAQTGLLHWPLEQALDFAGLLTALADVQARPAQTPHTDNRLLDTADGRLLLFTSGSSGAPKGVLHGEKSLLRLVSLTAQGLGLTPASVMLCHLPLGHVSGLLDCCAAAQLAGSRLVFQPEGKPARVLASVREQAVTLLLGTPGWFARLLADKHWPISDHHSLQRLVLIAERPGVELCRQLVRSGVTVQRGYGLSEGGSLVTLTEPGLSADALCASIGLPLSGIGMRLVDDVGLDVPAASTGEIQLNRDARFLAYWRDPQATQQALTPDGWLRTGDMACRTPAGLSLQGRLSGRFVSHGQAVLPELIEEALESLDQVVQAVVVAIPDARQGRVTVAFVIPSGFDVEAVTLESALSSLLPVEQMPRHWVLSANFPLLPIGKPDRALLQKDAEHLFAGR